MSANIYQNGAGGAIPISDQVDLRTRNITKDKKISHSGKRISFPREENNPTCACSKQQRFKIQELKTKGKKPKAQYSLIIGKKKKSLRKAGI